MAKMDIVNGVFDGFIRIKKGPLESLGEDMDNTPPTELSAVEVLEITAEVAMYMAADGDLLQAVNLVSDIFEELDAVVLESCISQLLLKAATVREKDIHSLFKKNYKTVLGKDCKIIKRKNDLHYIPDFWIKKDSQVIPVECKLYEFDKKALSQLLRYMDFYGCSHGVAVGKKLTCEIPDTITFISTSQL